MINDIFYCRDATYIPGPSTTYSKKYNNLVLWRILFTYRQCGFQKVQLVGWHGRKLPNFHQNTTTRLSAPQTRRARFILLSAGDRMKFQLCHSYYPLFVDRQCSKMSLKKSLETQQNQYPTCRLFYQDFLLWNYSTPNRIGCIIIVRDPEETYIPQQERPGDIFWARWSGEGAHVTAIGPFAWQHRDWVNRELFFGAGSVCRELVKELHNHDVTASLWEVTSSNSVKLDHCCILH